MIISLVFYRKFDFNFLEGDIGLLFKKVYSMGVDLNIIFIFYEYMKNSRYLSLI